jgi:ribosomal protein S26
MYSNIRYTYTESSQWDAGTVWMLLYIHGKFTMGCRYCLNVAIHTRKVHNGMQVLPECCYTYTESLQWDAGTAWMLLYIYGKFTVGCRYCLNVAIHTRKVHSGMQVLPECCYTYTESSQWDTGYAWMLLCIHWKFTVGCRYCLNVAMDTCRRNLYPIVNFPYMYNNIQAVHASHCELSVYV